MLSGSRKATPLLPPGRPTPVAQSAGSGICPTVWAAGRRSQWHQALAVDGVQFDPAGAPPHHPWSTQSVGGSLSVVTRNPSPSLCQCAGPLWCRRAKHHGKRPPGSGFGEAEKQHPFCSHSAGVTPPVTPGHGALLPGSAVGAAQSPGSGAAPWPPYSFAGSNFAPSPMGVFQIDLQRRGCEAGVRGGSGEGMVSQQSRAVGSRAPGHNLRRCRHRHPPMPRWQHGNCRTTTIPTSRKSRLQPHRRSRCAAMVQRGGEGAAHHDAKGCCKRSRQPGSPAREEPAADTTAASGSR